MAPSSSDASRPRGRFGWLGRLWRRRAPDIDTPIPTLPTRLTINIEETLPPFTTPAHGDAHDFTVSIDLCWCVTGVGAEHELRGRIDARRAELTAAVQAATRPIGRRYAPYRPGDAEGPLALAVRDSIDATLAATPDEYGAVLSCVPRLRVEMEPALRELQRPLAEAQIKLEGRFDLSALYARRLDELRRIWRDVIRAGLPEWESPYAADVALHPEQAAKALFAIDSARRKEAESLVERVAKVTTSHEQLDLLEFALVSDTALRRTFELLGIPLPDAGPESPFASSPSGPAL